MHLKTTGPFPHQFRSPRPARRKRPSLGLPGMGGMTLVRKLKADSHASDIHIVAVTTYPEQYPKAAVLAAGCDAYLVKPINTRELSGQLTTVVKRGGAAH
jgi:DNA-binding response OmpR family regulator